MLTNRKMIQGIINHILIGLVIVFGTSAVTLAARIERDTPGMSLYERVMLMIPCGQ